MRRLRLRGPAVALPLVTAEAVGAYNGQIYARGRDGFGSEPVGDTILEEFAAATSGEDEPDGMYAVAIAPRDGSSVALATDRDFIKPLFYRRSPGGLAFCSELAPLVALAGNTLNTRALAELFLFGWYVDDQTYLADLRLVARRDVRATAAGIVEAPKPKPEARGSPTPENSLRAAIAASVEASVSGRGPFGLALSGGLDSSILAFELNALGVEDLVTISVLVDGDGISSLEELGLPAGPWTKWQHRAIELDWEAEFAARFRTASLRFGQPTGMSSLVLIEAIAETASQEGVSVLLTGEGVDEYFCGYPEYRTADQATSWYDFYVAPARERAARALFGQQLIHEARVGFEARYAGEADLRQVEREMRLARLLLRTDVALMARTIEGRVPFLHRGIPELALATPWEEMVHGGGKALLRRAYESLLGPRSDIRKRRFKLSDAFLRRHFTAPRVQARLLHSLAPVLGASAVSACLEAISAAHSFDTSAACLWLSFASLVDAGVLDGHLA